MARQLLISDLHLSADRPAATERFERFLTSETSGAQALYVLGDLFEYWIGDDELTAAGGDPLGARVASAFGDLAMRGVRVGFMHGNRDFLVGRLFCSMAGATLIEDPSVVEIGGVPTLLLHGDTLCLDDLDYQDWRRTCRTAQWRDEFLRKPLADRRRIVRGLREQSKAATRGKAPEVMDVAQRAVLDAFRRHRVARMIHGHTHRPARHEHDVDGRRCERWVLPDWYGPGGYLEVADGVPRLVSY